MNKADPLGLESGSVALGQLVDPLQNSPLEGAAALLDVAANFANGLPGGPGDASFLSGLAGIARGGEALSEGAAAVGEGRAAQLARNVAQGARGEARIAARLGDRVAGKQVSFKTSSGAKTRADFVTKDKSVVETKTGGAQLTKNQQELHNDINAGRQVTPVGRNAAEAGLNPGQATTMKACSVDRPC